MQKLGGAGVLWVVGGVVGVNAVLVQILSRTDADEERLRLGAGKPVRGDEGVTTKTRSRWQALGNRSFALYTIAMFLVFAGLWVPYFHMRTFAVDALDMSPSDLFAVLMIFNTAGIQGRIIPALLSDSVFGTINTYILILLLTSLVLLCWPLVVTKADMFVWAGAYGLSSGGAASLVQTGVLSLYSDKSKLGGDIGIVFGVAGTASLVGAPVGGELIETGTRLFNGGSESFLLLQLCTGGFIMLSCAALFAARVAKTGWQVVVRI